MGIGEFHQVGAIFCFAKLFTKTVKLVGIYPTLTPGYLFDAADTEALTVLYGSYKVACFQQAVTVSGIEPCKTTTEDFDFQRALVQIQTVQIRNFIFATGGRFQGGSLAVTVES